jgi:succinoglycan biosynthesis transport protein ExoP
VIDARALAPKLDAFLFVVEWGSTPRHLVQTTLHEEWLVAEKCAGIILNKVDTKRLRLYEEDGPTTYYGGNSAYYSDGTT